MNRGIVILAVTVGSAALFGASRPAPTAREMEVIRLERHFDAVDLELKSRDVSHYTAPQRANRAQLISWLRDYRNAGRFPINDRFAEPTPFFRDKDGVLCAMAYLIARSGRTDIVDRVSATRNNAYIRELVDDPTLVAWLDSWGLTAAEAARIQPSYGDVIIYPPEDDYVESDFALAALGLGSLSLATSAVNVIKPSYFSGVLGVLAGTASILAGASYLDDTDDGDTLAGATIGLGAVSVGAGIYGILDARRNRDRDRGWDRDRDRRRRKFSMSVMPDVGVRQEKPAVGLLVHGRF
jgi:hypothetical protein